MGEPLSGGAFQEIVETESPATATTFRGAPGKPILRILLDGKDTGPLPYSFVAVTVNV